MSANHGFALLTVLWLILLLSLLVTTEVAPIVLTDHASQNGVELVRARWAAVACLELVRERFSNGAVKTRLDSLALGPAVWCDAEPLNPDERVNPNVGDSVGLQRVLGDPGRVAAILDWIDRDDTARDAGAEAGWYARRHRPLPRNRPIRDVAELQLVRGFEETSLEQLESVFTARGDGRISPNRAPAWALVSISPLTQGDVAGLVAMRGGQTFLTPEQLVSVAGIDVTIDEFRELTSRLSFTDAQRTIRCKGWVNMGTRVVGITIVADLRETRGELEISQVESQ